LVEQTGREPGYISITLIGRLLPVVAATSTGNIAAVKW
jgi:hypothetical protein